MLSRLSIPFRNSEFHGVGPVVLGEGEAGGHVLSEQGLFLVLDILDECAVDGSMQSLAFSGNDLLLGALLGEDLVSLFLVLLAAGEHLVTDLGNVDALEVDLGAGGDGVNLVDAFERHAVDLVWAGHSEQTTVQSLQENNSLATESTREQDENSAWLETLAKLGDAGLLGSGLSGDVLCGIPLELFDH